MSTNRPQWGSCAWNSGAITRTLRDTSCVYVVYHGACCVYVGESGETRQRVLAHFHGKSKESAGIRWWSPTTVKVLPVQGEARRKAIESHLIKTLRPKVNKKS